MPTKIETARIAAAVNLLRPDWRTDSLQTLIEKRHGNRPYLDVAVALVYVACDPDSRAPARLDEDGPWWRATRPATTGDHLPQPPPVAEILAQQPAPAPPPPDLRDQVAEARRQLRDELAGRAYHQPEGADT